MEEIRVGDLRGGTLPVQHRTGCLHRGLVQLDAEQLHRAAAVVHDVMRGGEELRLAAGRLKHPVPVLAQRPLGHEACDGFRSEVRTAGVAPCGVLLGLFSTQHTSIFPWHPDRMAGPRSLAFGGDPIILRTLRGGNS